jgi:MFS family permease
VRDAGSPSKSTQPDPGVPTLTSGAGRQLLAFGFLLTFLSSFGQTFFIGLFSDELRTSLGLGEGAFGTLYSAATLASAFCVFWAGAWIDRVALRVYLTAAVALLIAGCLLLTRSQHVATLALAFFLLRFAGQGLLTHTAVTTLARHFFAARGRALSIALLGHPAGEAVLPFVAVVIIGAFGWQSVWIGAAALALIVLPLLLKLGPAARRVPSPAAVSATQGHGAHTDDRSAATPDATRRDVLRDRRFHLLIPTVLLPPFIITGMFIHQTRLIAEKDWTLSWYALSFVAFAAAQVAGMLGAGPLVDRLSARRIAPFYLLPLGFACVLVTLTDHPWVALPFMAGGGLTTGIAMTTVTALWAELYGVTHLGAIRALSVSLLIFATALAPALFGWTLEAGISFASILLACAAASATAAVLAHRALAPARVAG